MVKYNDITKEGLLTSKDILLENSSLDYDGNLNVKELPSAWLNKNYNYSKETIDWSLLFKSGKFNSRILLGFLKPARLIDVVKEVIGRNVNNKRDIMKIIESLLKADYIKKTSLTINLKEIHYQVTLRPFIEFLEHVNFGLVITNKAFKDLLEGYVKIFYEINLLKAVYSNKKYEYNNRRGHFILFLTAFDFKYVKHLFLNPYQETLFRMYNIKRPNKLIRRLDSYLNLNKKELF